MKITNKDGKVYEGTANELANYFKGMTYRKTKKVKKDTTAPPSQTELDIYVVERDAANTIWKNTPKLKKRISSTGKFPRAR